VLRLVNEVDDYLKYTECILFTYHRHMANIIITVTYTVEMGGGESGILLLNEMKQTKT